MYLARISLRRVVDITEALRCSKVSPTIIVLNKKDYVHFENCRNRPLQGNYPYVYVVGIYLLRNCGDEYETISIFLTIAVIEVGSCDVLETAEGM